MDSVRRCDDCPDFRESVIELRESVASNNTTLALLVEEVRGSRADIQCLQRRWWKSAGAVIGIMALLSILSTGLGVAIGMKRLQADYVKKADIPAAAIVEHHNRTHSEHPEK